MSDEPETPVIPFDKARAKPAMARELSHVIPGTVTPDTIEELRRRKLIREASESVEIEGIRPGEREVGYLNPSEQALYIEILNLTTELEDLSQELHARSFEMAAAAVRKTGRGQDITANLDNKIMFADRQSAEDYFSTISRLEYLRAVYNQSIRERYGHSVVLGVRAGFVVVAVRDKYDMSSFIATGTGE